MDTLIQDLRYAIRTLRKSPGFTAVAGITLGLGIGATTAMFSVVDGVLLTPLTVEQPDRVLVTWKEHRARDFPHLPFSYPAFRDVRDRSRTLEGVAALPYWGASRWVARMEGEAVPVRGAAVTGDFFRVLGVGAARGRVLRPGDDVVGAGPVAVISHGAWQRLFGRDPGVVGRRLGIGGTTYTIVGVTPERFEYPRSFDSPAGTDVWVPLVPSIGHAAGRPPLASRGRQFLYLVARIAPGSNRVQAEAELGAILSQIAAEHPDAAGEQAIVVRSLPEVVVGDVRPALWVLSAAVGLVLLIAGVNVANLLLVRGLARRYELTIRASLGAGRGRIARQLLTETLVLGMIGGIVGVLVAAGAVGGLTALAPPDVPRMNQVGIDGRTLLFATVVSVVAAALFGLVPALGVGRSDLAVGFPSRTGPVGLGGARSALRGRARWGARSVLVIGQIALTAVVIVGAALLVRSLLHLQSVERGFRTERRLLAEVAVPASGYESVEQRRALFDRIVPRVEALPGIVSATPALAPPFSGNGGFDITFSAEGQDAAEAEGNPFLNYEAASPGYFRTLGLSIVRGRGITSADREGSAPVVVVNETTARLIWPGADPVGKRIKWGGPDSADPWRTVVGVAADARYRALETVRPSVYVPWEQGIPVAPGYLVVRTASDPAAVVSPLRHVLAEIDPDVAIVDAVPFTRLLDEPLARPRFNTALLGVFAALALILAAIGIYGTLSASVRQRTPELGIRMALGARSGQVLRLVLGQGIGIAAIGIGIGLAVALAGTRVMSSLLYDVSATEPVAFAAAAVVLAAVALLASYIPARRATRVDPMVALRAE